jgi:hypothetical protein
MPPIPDTNTRYFVDLNLNSKQIICWGHDQRHTMTVKLPIAGHYRLLVSKGQYN